MDSDIGEVVIKLVPSLGCDMLIQGLSRAPLPANQCLSIRRKAIAFVQARPQDP
jgi:hypothetical protein